MKGRMAVLSAVVRDFVGAAGTGAVVATEGEAGAVIVWPWLEDASRSRAKVLAVDTSIPLIAVSLFWASPPVRRGGKT
ncbi:MAG: hypothetical protein ACJ8AB_08860 [Gemmatimonadaceae bacterium]